MLVSLDFETCSDLDLPKVGAWVYAQHPSTRVRVACTQHGQWFPEQPRPEWACEEAIVSAHNAFFEYCIWNFCCTRLYGFPPLPIWRFLCTMARVQEAGLPGKLKDACTHGPAAVQKDLEGRRLMLKLAKAKAIPKPGELERLAAYCDNDVAAESALVAITPPISERERGFQLVDWAIQQRGVRIDPTLCKAAIAMSKTQIERLDEPVRRVTGIGVAQVKALLAWLSPRCGIPDLGRDTVDRYIRRGVDDQCRTVLIHRVAASRSSASKYAKALMVLADDGRVHGLTQFYGAERTGRHAGRLFQPQNLPRGRVDMQALCAAILRGDVAAVASVAQSVPLAGWRGEMSEPFAVMHGLAIATRGMIVGDLVVGDYSRVELVVLFWLAGEPALEALRAGIDLYREVAAEIYGVTVAEVTPEQRDIGKRVVLGCGYGMGEGLFWSTCAREGVDILGEDAARAVGVYRSRFRAVPQLWYDLHAGAVRAIIDRRAVWIRSLCWEPCGRHLLLRLPSGHCLWYRDAEVRDGQFCFYGRDDASKANVWKRIHAHGGMVTGHAVQALARGILMHGLSRCEYAGLAPVLSIHDEPICDSPHTTEDALRTEMSVLPSWCAGLPLKTDVWSGPRYQKH